MRTRLIASVLLAAMAAACGGESGPDLAVTGQPCPSLTAAQFTAIGRAPEEETAAGGAIIRRQFGRAACESVGSSGSGGTDGTGRCDLTNPGLLHVTSGGADTYYDMPTSQPATITVDRGQVRCVMTPRQR